MMLRRAILSSSALAGLASATACQTLNPTLAQVTTDVQLIANGLQGILPDIATLASIPADVAAAIANALANLQVVAGQIGSASSTSSAQPLVQQVVTYVNIIVKALAVIPLIPPPISTVLQAAVVLLPIIEAAVGLIVTPVPSLRTQQMQPEGARLILKSSAAKVRR
jgi:hypothetical protein